MLLNVFCRFKLMKKQKKNKKKRNKYNMTLDPRIHDDDKSKRAFN